MRFFKIPAHQWRNLKNSQRQGFITWKKIFQTSRQFSRNALLCEQIGIKLILDFDIGSGGRMLNL